MKIKITLIITMTYEDNTTKLKRNRLHRKQEIIFKKKFTRF